MPTDELHKLTEDPNRILGAIAFVVQCAHANGRVPTQYDIVKTLFLADRSHLNEWGRPITFDNYYAMKHGPVPHVAYNLLKGDEFTFRMLSLSEVPWRRQKLEKGKYGFHPTGTPSEYEGYLSASDRDALKAASGTVLKMGFSKVRKLTHEDPAYVDAWREEEDRGSFPMKLSLLFEEPDAEAAAELAEYSEYARAG